MICRKCGSNKPDAGSKNGWCSDCRKEASNKAKSYRRDHPKKLCSGTTYESRQFNLLQLGFKSYREYLNSPLWRKVRQRVFAAKGSMCALCFQPATEVHHNRYHRNDLTGKTLNFVDPICHECHEKLEFTKKGKKCELHEAKNRFKHCMKDENQRLSEVLL